MQATPLKARPRPLSSRTHPPSAALWSEGQARPHPLGPDPAPSILRLQVFSLSWSLLRPQGQTSKASWIQALPHADLTASQWRTWELEPRSDGALDLDITFLRPQTQTCELLRRQATSCGLAICFSCFVNSNPPSKPLPSSLTQRPFAKGFDFCRIKARDTDIHHHPP